LFLSSNIVASRWITLLATEQELLLYPCRQLVHFIAGCEVRRVHYNQRSVLIEDPGTIADSGEFPTFSLIAGFTLLLVRLLLILIFFGTPLFGFWLASSLAAYLGGPHWMAWTAGALLFPIIPGAWEFRAWTYRHPERKAWFTPLDRLSLRTFAVGLSFMTVLLCVYPQTAFVSLSTRGDWMLDGVKDPRADKARRALFIAAGGLEWLYRATKDNPYKALIDPQARKSAEEAEQELAKQNHQNATVQDGKGAAQPKHGASQQDHTGTSQPSETDVADQISAEQREQDAAQRRKHEAAHQSTQEAADQGTQEASPRCHQQRNGST
jgi:hypothetical protein